MISGIWVSLKSRFPQLFSFARKKVCSVKQFLSWEDNRSLFPPLSQIAFASAQLIQLKNEMQLFSLIQLVRMKGLILGDPLVTSVTKLMRFYKALTLPPLYLSGNGNLTPKTSTNFSFGFFEIDLIPEICCSGSIWSWILIFVFFVWRAWRRISSTYSFHAHSVMLAGLS
jgi:hypothetical protein